MAKYTIYRSRGDDGNPAGVTAAERIQVLREEIEAFDTRIDIALREVDWLRRQRLELQIRLASLGGRA